jgi:hypothetical protein
LEWQLRRKSRRRLERQVLAEPVRFSEGSERGDAPLVYRWIDVNVYRKSTGRGSVRM